ncbi:MAG: hypothetical protein M1838_003958 [Thelocarpon superellum]|nr:MAG: hypothetical protein M1838_003958 [Thelocarpon superellum]
MRLFLLPISRRRTLIYCQRQFRVTTDRLSLLDKATGRAAKLWLQWESSNKSWQKRITQYGNQLLQRIPYEEWGLKSVPPLSARRKDEEMADRASIPVTFPTNVIPSSQVGSILRTLAVERQALHRSRLWGSIVVMPVTAPVALVPIIPNLPFFYLVYRAWSHWRALSGSKHLEFLLDKNLLQSSPSLALDTIYATKNVPLLAATSTAHEDTARADDDDPTSKAEKDTILLQPSDAKLIADRLSVPELVVELERAVHQVQAALSQDTDAASQTTQPSRTTTDAKDGPKR